MTGRGKRGGRRADVHASFLGFEEVAEEEEASPGAGALPDISSSVIASGISSELELVVIVSGMVKVVCTKVGGR